MPTYFISDLHLSEASIASNQTFYLMLEKLKGNIDALYILGDFFDFWCGDDDNNSFINDIKVALKLFTAITPIYFVRGNHDFALGKRFAQDTGVIFLKDLSRITIDNINILISHGDAFCTLDKPYQRMKSVIQNKYFIACISLLPLKLRYKIKDLLFQKSHKTNNHVTHHNLNVVNSTIAKYANACNASTVIHGHTHNPGIYKVFDHVTRYEIPDWTRRSPGGYINITNGKITIFNSNNAYDQAVSL